MPPSNRRPFFNVAIRDCVLIHKGHVAVSLPVCSNFLRERNFHHLRHHRHFSLYHSFLPQHHLRLSFTSLLIIGLSLSSCLPKDLREPASQKRQLRLRLGQE